MVNVTNASPQALACVLIPKVDQKTREVGQRDVVMILDEIIETSSRKSSGLYLKV